VVHAVGVAYETISPSDAAGFIHAAGYSS